MNGGGARAADRAWVAGRATIAGKLRHDVRRRPAGGPGTPPWTSTFLRGLAIGALVGAGIAGSRLWERRRRGHSGTTEDPGGPVSPAT